MPRFFQLSYFCLLLRLAFILFAGISPCAFANDFGRYTDLQRNIDQNYYRPHSAEEQEYYDKIVDLRKGEGISSSRPKVVLTVGPMAAGKTRVVSELFKMGLLLRSNFAIIDPDEIKMQLTEFKNKLATLKEYANDPTLFHRQSMFVSDMLMQAAISNQRNVVYVTSMRHVESGAKLIHSIRRDHPSYQIILLNVKAPSRHLLHRSHEREQVENRLAPDELVQNSIADSERAFHILESSVDTVLQAVNDEERAPRINYVRNRGRIDSVDLQLGKATGSTRDLAIVKAAISGGAVSPSLPTADFILDCDWVLNYILADKSFQVADGISEFFSALFQLPQIRVSVFSGGNRERNESLLRGVKLNNGTNLYERLFRILSFENLRQAEKDDSRNFTDRYKKDMREISAALDLEQSIFADDQVHFAVDSEQDKSFLEVDHTYNWTESYIDRQSDPFFAEGNDSRYFPQSEFSWRLERNKLAWILGIFMESRRISLATQTSLRSSFLKLTRDAGGQRISREHVSQFKFYELGKRAMDLVNPHWQKVKLPVQVECPGVLAE
jgi:hypothetical protein